MIAETIKAILTQAQAEIKEINDSLRQKAIQHTKERVKTTQEDLYEIEDENLTKREQREKTKELGMAKELGVSGTVLIGYKIHAYI